jgi:uncharacterized repeat protein (TIGR03803 family)
MTPAGALTTLHIFTRVDGAQLFAGLIQATDGNFYGTTNGGGANGQGTAFKMTSNGVLTTLYNFCSESGCVDGAGPEAALVQATNGKLYGTTGGGGTGTCAPYGCGTAFSLSLGLQPFIATAPTLGEAGKSVIILGTNLTGATSVTFNAAPATFTVGSATYIKTTVPAEATTGPIQVVTPSGTLTSNVNFQVLP